MTRTTPRAVAFLVLAIALAAGCVHYPSVTDIGGTRIVPRNGHAVREGDTLRFYVELDSTGKFGDVVTGIESPVAAKAELVSASGTRLEQLEIPGADVVRLEPDGPHGVLSGLKRDVKRGETLIVTLTLRKSGGLGVVTVVE